MNQTKNINIKQADSDAINEIFRRRANEIASYCTEHRDKLPGSVELALDREMSRLRRIADIFTPEPTLEDE